MGYPSFADVEALWRRLHEETPAGQALLVNGLDRLLQQVTEPDSAMLDQYFPDRPVVVLDNSGHEVYFTTATMEAIGWADHKPPADPVGARFGRKDDGTSDGRAYETAAVFTVVEPILKQVVEHPLLSGAKWYALMAGNGITATSDMTYSSDQLPGYEALAAAKDCPLRMSLYHMSIHPDCGDKLTSTADPAMVRKQGIKLWADGSPWVGTIANSYPFLDTPTVRNAGIPLGPGGEAMMNYTRAQLDATLAEHVPQGWQMSFHVNGDVGLDIVLDAYERALADNGLLGTDHRWRVWTLRRLPGRPVPAGCRSRRGGLAGPVPVHLLGRPARRQDVPARDRRALDALGRRGARRRPGVLPQRRPGQPTDPAAEHPGGDHPRHRVGRGTRAGADHLVGRGAEGRDHRRGLHPAPRRRDRFDHDRQGRGLRRAEQGSLPGRSDAVGQAGPGAPHLAGRPIAGVGLVTVFGAAFAYIRAVVPPGRIAGAIGTFTAVTGLATLLLTFVAGSLSSVDWRAAFLAIPALSLVCIPAVLAILPRQQPHVAGKQDVVGQFLLGLGVVGFQYGISNMATSLTGPLTLGPILVGAVLLIAFFGYEARNDNRFLPVSLFRDPIFLAAVFIGLADNLTNAVSFLQTTNLWQYVTGLKASEVSVWQLPMLIAGLLAAVVFGRLMLRGLSARAVVVIGSTSVVLGFGYLAVFRSATKTGQGLDAVTAYARNSTQPEDPLGKKALADAVTSYGTGYAVAMLVAAGVTVICGIVAFVLLSRGNHTAGRVRTDNSPATRTARDPGESSSPPSGARRPADHEDPTG